MNVYFYFTKPVHKPLYIFVLAPDTCLWVCCFSNEMSLKLKALWAQLNAELRNGKCQLRESLPCSYCLEADA